MKKTKIISIRVTKEELKIIEKNAKAKGLSKSAYLRHFAITDNK